MNKHFLTIAIDGPSAAGKGTLSKKIAQHYNLAHMDTGLLYRSVGYLTLQSGNDLADSQAVNQAAGSLTTHHLSLEVLREDRIAQAASQIAVHAAVRETLRVFQRAFAANPPEDKHGSVLDGRDIGTRILPEAHYKFFITASLEARAERRYLEFRQQGIDCLLTDVLSEMYARDERDHQRTVAPLAAASDAVVVDTSCLSISEAFQTLCAYIKL